MGCCGRPRHRSVYNQNDPTPCKVLEQGGASLRLWILSTSAGHRVVIKSSGSMIELSSFLGTYGCSGPTARMLQNNLARISAAVNNDPATFKRYSGKGVSMVQLLKLVDAVTQKQRSRPNAKGRPL